MRKLAIGVGTLCLLFGLAMAAAAQNGEGGPPPGAIPEGGPPPGTQMGPGEIPMGPSETGPTIAPPVFPGITQEFRDKVGEAKIVQLYCLMSKWKTGEFFAAMDSLKANLIPALEQVKAAGVDISIPDVDGFIAQGHAKLDAVCNASTVEGAQAAATDFVNYGNTVKGEFDAVRTDMQAKTKVKAQELQDKVKSELQPFIDEQKTKIEAELKPLVDDLVAKAKADITAKLQGQKFTSAEEADAFVQPLIAASKAGINTQVQAKANELSKTAQAEIEAKVQAIIGPEKSKLEALGNLFTGMQGKIQSGIEAGKKAYDQYRDQAFALRKDMVMSMVDAQIAKAKDQLGQQRASFEDLKKTDPSIKGVDEILAELASDRAALASKIDQALADGDETAFQAAIDAFKNKWENYQKDAEKAAMSSVSQVCEKALPQISVGENQMDSQLQQIDTLESRCATSTTDECLKVNQFADRLGVISDKLSALKSEMSQVRTLCQSPETADRKQLTGLLDQLKADGQDAKTYGEALDAEKSKVIADSAAKICDQVVPQLEAAKTEIQKNDLAQLQSRVAQCAGKSTNQCKAVNSLAGQVTALAAKIKNFVASVAQIESQCKAGISEADFEQVGTVLNVLRSQGDDLKETANALRADQEKNASMKSLCAAIGGSMDDVRNQVSTSLKAALAQQATCSGKTDPACVAVAGLAPRFADLKAKSEALLKKIAEIGQTCKTAGVEIPPEDFVAKIDSVQTDGDSLKSLADQLKADAEKIKPSAGSVWLEAENESKTGLLPRTEPWHSIKGKSTDSWRPPVFGTGYWYLSRGGEWLQYDFTAPTDGSYSFWIRDLASDVPGQEGQAVVTVAFDGKTLGSYAENVPGRKVHYPPGAFFWHKTSAVTLKAGQHVLRITKQATTSRAAILDAYYLTTGNDVPPEK